MKYAVRSKYIHSNPLDDTTPPKASYYREMDVLTPEQVKGLLDTVRGHRRECAVVLGAVCGLRIGEALSLRYEDLDLRAGTVQVRRAVWRYKVYPPKTPSSRRTLKPHRLPWRHYGGTRKRTATLKRDGASPLRTATPQHRKVFGLGVGNARYGTLAYPSQPPTIACAIRQHHCS